MSQVKEQVIEPVSTKEQVIEPAITKEQIVEPVSTKEQVIEQVIESVKKPERKPKYKKNLVLSGGGVKGIAHIGGLFALQKLGILDKFETFSVASVGAFTACLYSIGYTPAELYDFIKIFDFVKLKNIDITNIFNYGLDNGEKLEYVLKRLIKNKCQNENITLKEVYDKYKKKIIFSTVCVNDMDIHYISWETNPDLELWLAMRMTSAVPFYFCPVLYKGKYYVDGGTWDNYPMCCYTAKELEEETIGLFLHSGRTTYKEILDPETYVLQVLRSLMFGFTQMTKKGYEKNTINIDLEHVNILDFDISSEMKDILFIIGFQSVLQQQDKLL
ncbi:MAG: patatin-like phospholipase [Barrevirus sp.]|uniref:Patatin-like phospholipase n=1 Tax=Barrevirus sp. TaxID=2487763 RepID=A0A3G4ZV85_9VIRU|nr:MAG: patatin-like phospholipase [Barrevirus sp.]